MDINSLIANYLQSSGSDLSVSEVAERMNNLGNQIGYCKMEGETESIFTYGDNATEEELYDFIESTCSSIDDYDQFAEDVNLLFNILDTSGDGVLSDDELQLFKRNAGSNQGYITDYKFYDLLTYGTKAGEIQSNIEGTNSDDGTASASEDTDSTDDTETAIVTLSDDEISAIADEIASGEKSLDDYADSLSYSQYLQLEEAVNDAVANLNESGSEEETDEEDTTVNDTTISDTSTIEGMKAKIEEIVLESDTDSYTCPEDVISELESSGAHDSEFIEELRNSFITYSEEDEEKISIKLEILQLSNPDATREDAIAALEENSEIGSPITDANTELSSDTDAASAISDTAASIIANELYNTMKGLGTENKEFKSILYDEDLTSADWVKIIAAYNEEHGSFVKDVDNDFSCFSGEGKIMDTIAENLIEQAEAGNDEAIKLLCKEFYNGTAGKLGTADQFISAIFEQASDEVLAKIAENYEDVTGSNISEDINGDFSSNKAKKYINRLIEALGNS